MHTSAFKLNPLLMNIHFHIWSNMHKDAFKLIICLWIFPFLFEVLCTWVLSNWIPVFSLKCLAPEHSQIEPSLWKCLLSSLEHHAQGRSQLEPLPLNVCFEFEVSHNTCAFNWTSCSPDLALRHTFETTCTRHFQVKPLPLNNCFPSLRRHTL